MLLDDMVHWFIPIQNEKRTTTRRPEEDNRSWQKQTEENEEEEEGGGEEEAVHEHPEHPGGQAPPRENPGGLREAIERKIFAFLWYSSKREGGSRPIHRFETLFLCFKPMDISAKIRGGGVTPLFP